MKKGGGQGSSTLTGIRFERKVDLATRFKEMQGYEVINSTKAGLTILYKGEIVGRMLPKHDFYRYLKEEGVNWKDIISKKLLPDNALLVIVRETLFIIEVKYQQTGGSVDEKLQTCDFKRKQYIKLTHSLGLRVEYVYLLSDWFSNPGYRDALDYILSVNCHYKFGEIPLSWLGLPDPKA